ncbi:MAG: SDR family oxidoreductase [Gemmatimonadaceae bacterium]|nr:SDR family oxidoreductase [Acetobacteraceae bacterium]
MAEKKIVLVTGAGSGIGRAIAEALARAGHCVYASMRSIMHHDRTRADELRRLAQRQGADLRVIELDVLSDASCRAAVDQVVVEQGRIDVVVNNAGMLMVGITEAFTPEQLIQVFETNAVSWLRVNRAALPAMRRQGGGVLVYISSTTARLAEPFLGPYIASKAAGEALAEVMGFEVSRFGIETVIVVPGAFTRGTEHFRHAHPPADAGIVAQYGDLPRVAEQLGPRLQAIDDANGGALDVSAIGDAVQRALDLPHGSRPARIVIDSQQKGMEALNALHHAKQAAFLEQLGLHDLMTLPDARRRAAGPSRGSGTI